MTAFLCIRYSLRNMINQLQIVSYGIQTSCPKRNQKDKDDFHK